MAIVSHCTKGAAADGTPQEVYNQPQTVFVAQFMGSPSMNLINGKVQTQNTLNPNVIGGGEPALHLTHTDIWIELSAEQISRIDRSDEIVFGVRPEHIVVSKEPNGIRFQSIGGTLEAWINNIIDIFLVKILKTELLVLHRPVHTPIQARNWRSVWFDSCPNRFVYSTANRKLLLEDCLIYQRPTATHVKDKPLFERYALSNAAECRVMRRTH